MAEKPKAPPPAPAFKMTPLVLVILVLSAPFLANSLSSLVPALVAPFADMFSEVIGVYTGFATIFCMCCIVGTIYASVRLSEIRTEDAQKLGFVFNWKTEVNHQQTRWVRVEEHMNKDNISDWKIAIMEADNILDDIVERMGYPGKTLGERMKVIEPSDFPRLEEAWEAHKIRNQIAHKGTDFALDKGEAERVISMYKRVFKGVGYL